MEITTVVVGYHVEVRDWFGELKHGTVVGVYADVKNGRPGIDYTQDNGGTYWAYIDQVEAAYPADEVEVRDLQDLV